MKELKAILFDLDGTLLDNNDFHKQAWQQYLKQNGKDLSDEDFEQKISGRTDADAIEQLFGKMSEDEAKKHYMQRLQIYLDLYKPHIAPISGLENFLQNLKDNNISMAIATSGLQENIDFMFEHVPIKKFFTEIIQANDISKGKPDPEIFLKAAEALKLPAEQCIVFEDSISGVKAGKAAGMKVVALTTTQTPKELDKADLVIKDYTEIDYEKLTGLSK